MIPNLKHLIKSLMITGQSIMHKIIKSENN